MKKIMMGVLITVIILALATSAIALASNGEKTATPSQTKFILDGKEVTFDIAYNIENSNYIQLRSVAQMLSGTASQFNVYWDNDLRQAVIETGKSYTGVKPAPSSMPTDAPASDPTYKVGDTITMANATIRLTSVTTASSTPPDEYGSKFVAGSGKKFLCISFEVTANNLNYNNTLWYPISFIEYATAVSGINYECPFSQGTTKFGPNEKKAATVYIEIPDNETIEMIVISDGAHEETKVSVD
jgi:hypothetical protein